MKYNYSTAYFLGSSSTIHDLPNHEPKDMEIAFIGYSNSGKSSTINALTNKKKLARIGQIPGTTKFINLFKIQPNILFVDFPGYGYSKTIKMKNYWYEMIHQYLKKRKNLRGLILHSDIRHTLKDFDQKVIHNALSFHIPVLILLNKSDKISKNKANQVLKQMKYKIRNYNTIKYYIQIKAFSAMKLYGIEFLKKNLNLWLS